MKSELLAQPGMGRVGESAPLFGLAGSANSFCYNLPNYYSTCKGQSCLLDRVLFVLLILILTAPKTFPQAFTVLETFRSSDVVNFINAQPDKTAYYGNPNNG